MYGIILQCLTNNLEGFAKNISDTLSTKKDASDLAYDVCGYLYYNIKS